MPGSLLEFEKISFFLCILDSQYRLQPLDPSVSCNHLEKRAGHQVRQKDKKTKVVV